MSLSLAPPLRCYAPRLSSASSARRPAPPRPPTSQPTPPRASCRYLQGETHYIVITIKKAALIDKGVLRADLPSAELLTAANLDEDALMRLARQVATIVGLPESTPFCDVHPAKCTPSPGPPHRLTASPPPRLPAFDAPPRRPTSDAPPPPLRLFDFSSRARCAAPFRVLGVKGAGPGRGSALAVDVQAQPRSLP